MPGADWRSLIDFGLAKTTARRLAGLPHVTPDVGARWLRYCQLRGPDSFRNSNVFLLTRLNRNDYPAPPWSALQRLEQRLKQGEAGRCTAGKGVMDTYGLQELIRRWGRDQLTTEQAIGQILLLLLELDKRVQKLKRRKESPPKQPPGKAST